MPDPNSTGPPPIPKDLIPFIAAQAPKAKYIMSVCGGSVYLAFAGLLAGKRATTNKAFYREVVVRFFVLFVAFSAFRLPPSSESFLVSTLYGQRADACAIL
jgi:putative intracellular protease/amidase